MATRDLGVTTIEVQDPIHSLPLSCGRGIKTAIGAIEACQLIGAFSDPVLVNKISPNFSEFMEPDGSFWGAYGTRIGPQLLYAVRKLQHDADSRQAVVTLWSPGYDNYAGHRDYPCTVGFNFSIENRRLLMNTVMRSNDVWLGLPYDLFQFTQLQLTVANILDIDVGPYTHTVWSLHIYERNLDAVKKLHDPSPRMPFHPHGIGRHGHTVEDAVARARMLPTPGWRDIYDITPSEDWYRRVFEKYYTPVVGRHMDRSSSSDRTEIFMRP